MFCRCAHHHLQDKSGHAADGVGRTEDEDKSETTADTHFHETDRNLRPNAVSSSQPYCHIVTHHCQTPLSHHHHSIVTLPLSHCPCHTVTHHFHNATVTQSLSHCHTVPVAQSLSHRHCHIVTPSLSHHHHRTVLVTLSL